MVAMFQCFKNGSRSPGRSHAPAPQPRQNWFQTIRNIFRNRKTRPDEEQGLMTPPSTQQQNVQAYGTFYVHGNVQVSPAIIEQASSDPNVHIGDFREFFPGFDGAPITPVSPIVSATSAPTQQDAVSPVTASVYSSTKSSSAKPKLEPTPESFASEYTVVKTLARNNEGPVHLVKSKASGEMFIIKQMRYGTAPDGTRLDPDEVYMMSQIKSNHPSIVRREDIIDDLPRGIANMVLEFCSAGDLDNLIKKCQGERQNIPEPIVLSVTASLIDAMAFLHHGEVRYDADTSRATIRSDNGQKPILHRDIKPGNIFLRWSDDNCGIPQAVLADFGLATLKEHSEIEGACGTDIYYAPEFKGNLWTPGICSEKSDIYALGVTLFELITGVPFKPERHNITRGFVCSSVRDHPRFLWLLQSCLATDSKKRPGATDLHRTSYVFKEHVREWYENGGRIPADFWPVPFANDHPIRQRRSASQRGSASSPPHYSQVSSPVSTNAPSMTDAVANLPPLRRVGRHQDLQAAAGAEYAQEIADIPGPFTSPFPSAGTESSVQSTDESAQATAGAQAPRSYFSWHSYDCV
ncbi:Serine/threonine-protein kinase Nek2 [Fulvia fulva]|uniref:non-specific serine/threonine protein kinase n=1 Tax=Passalora fulva TaxID=5499 RepID=A0A9Q8PBF7_PASFU|nr:Serine/threonine-protein kinase Nek2 [Fulvia fulva]KAK4622891.1 Serine/threonine-protein kinase Nek2 [Fulvia fulva]UJO19399.1 Serine/threonine-protein kinase Nek2 [Fulvia fulva]